MNRTIFLAGLFLPFAASAAPETSERLADRAEYGLDQADHVFVGATKAIAANNSLAIILPAMTDYRAYVDLHDRSALSPASAEGAAQWASLRAAARSIDHVETMSRAASDHFYTLAKRLADVDVESSEDANMLSVVFEDLADSAAGAYTALRTGEFQTIAAEFRGLLRSLEDIDHEIFQVEQ